MVVTDLVEPDGRTERPFAWERPLRRLAAAHETLVVEVVDPRELELPDVGTITLEDPETGPPPRGLHLDRKLRERYAAAAAAHRAAVAEAVRAARRRPRRAAHRPRLGARPGPPRPRRAPMRRDRSGPARAVR